MKLSDILNIVTSYTNNKNSITSLLQKLECEYAIAELELFIQISRFEKRIEVSNDAELTDNEKKWFIDYLATRWNRIKNSPINYHNDLFNPANRICIALADRLAGNFEASMQLLEPSRESPISNKANVEFEMIASILSEKLGIIKFCANVENIGIIFSGVFNYAQVKGCVYRLMLDSKGIEFLELAMPILKIEDKNTLIEIMNECANERQKYMHAIPTSNREIIIDDDAYEMNLKRLNDGVDLTASFNKKIKREGEFLNSSSGYIRANSSESARNPESFQGKLELTRTFNMNAKHNRGNKVVQVILENHQMKQERNQAQEKRTLKSAFTACNPPPRYLQVPNQNINSNSIDNQLYPSLHQNGIFKLQEVKSSTQALPACVIQIPSKKDIEGMKHMSAGSKEDQYLRLSNMVSIIEELKFNGLQIPVVNTDVLQLASHWVFLFEAIRTQSFKSAWSQFEKINPKDAIKAAILKTHSLMHLQNIIKYCVEARATGEYDLDGDVVFTPTTFEILIKDIATTLLNSSKMQMSFGLPTHHAQSDKSAGFCILNKTAIFMHHKARTSTRPLQYFIIGTDVNRDDGLCNVLLNTAFNSYYGRNLDINHVDIFDSRVYPKPDFSLINEAFNYQSYEKEDGISCFWKEGFMYYAVDLSVTTKHESKSIHPALKFAIQKLHTSIEDARKNRKQMVLLLPTGWDSHIDETAYCGKRVGGKMMSEKEASIMRFNDDDFKFFYSKLFELYNKYTDVITSIYWGLEGGYDTIMYENQIELTVDCIQKGLNIQSDLSFNMSS